MTCKLSLSSPFISIRIKLFVARSVVLCGLFLCRSLSYICKKRKQPHTRFFLLFFERARPRIFFYKNSQQTRRGGVERFWAIAFIFFSSSLERAKTVAPREETNKKNLKSFFKKKSIQIFLSIRASFCTKITRLKHDGSYETNRS